MCEMRWLLFFNWLILCITFIDFYMLGHLYLPGVSTILFSWIIFLTCCWIQLANILLMIFVYMFRDIDLYFFLCFLFLVLKMIWSHNFLWQFFPTHLVSKLRRIEINYSWKARKNEAVTSFPSECSFVGSFISFSISTLIMGLFRISVIMIQFK